MKLVLISTQKLCWQGVNIRPGFGIVIKYEVKNADYKGRHVADNDADDLHDRDGLDIKLPRWVRHELGRPDDLEDAEY